MILPSKISSAEKQLSMLQVYVQLVPTHVHQIQAQAQHQGGDHLDFKSCQVAFLLQFINRCATFICRDVS